RRSPSRQRPVRRGEAAPDPRNRLGPCHHSARRGNAPANDPSFRGRGRLAPQGAARPSAAPGRAPPLSGRATHGGIRFQDRVAALAAVRMLAGESLPASWAPFGPHAIAAVSLETGDAVDDVVVRLAGGQRCLVNAKTNLK